MSKQALLAAAALAGFALGRPAARRLAGVVPGVPAGDLGDNLVGILGATLAFQIAKRVLP